MIDWKYVAHIGVVPRRGPKIFINRPHKDTYIRIYAKRTFPEVSSKLIGGGKITVYKDRVYYHRLKKEYYFDEDDIPYFPDFIYDTRIAPPQYKGEYRDIWLEGTDIVLGEVKYYTSDLPTKYRTIIVGSTIEPSYKTMLAGVELEFPSKDKTDIYDELIFEYKEYWQRVLSGEKVFVQKKIEDWIYER